MHYFKRVIIYLFTDNNQIKFRFFLKSGSKIFIYVYLIFAEWISENGLLGWIYWNLLSVKSNSGISTVVCSSVIRPLPQFINDVYQYKFEQ